MPLTPSAQVIAQAVAMAQLYDSVLSGTAASFDVQNISQAYNHLKLVVLVRGDNGAAAQASSIRFNNDSAGNYQYNILRGNNSLTTSQLLAAQTAGHFGTIPGAGLTASYFAGGEILIPSYALTSAFKVYSSNLASPAPTAANAYMDVIDGVWSSTAAINRITLFPAAGSWIAGSRLTIYGLL